MKMFLQTKVVVILLLSIAVAAGIMAGCSSDQGDRGGTTARSSDGGSDGSRNDRRDDRRSQAKLKCELPSCSGSSCCDKEDKDGDLDEDCEDWCKKDLSLSGDAYDKCLALDEIVIEDDLLFLFDDRLNRPDFEELESLKSKDIEIICAAVKHLDSDLLSDRVDKYSTADAKSMLEWLATEETILEVYDSAEDEEGIKMIKKLLGTVGGGTDDGDILKGIGLDVSRDNDDENVLQLALKSGNENFVKYIHDEIITHDKEICAESNQPVPNATVIIPVEGGGTIKYLDKQPKNGYHYEACVLAAYCTISDKMNDEDGDEFRKDMADFISQSGIVNFVKRKAEDGGLDLADGEEDDDDNSSSAYFNLDEDDAEEWTHKACTNLEYFWDNVGNKTIFELGD